MGKKKPSRQNFDSDTVHDVGWEALASAVIIQALKDYVEMRRIELGLYKPTRKKNLSTLIKRIIKDGIEAKDYLLNYANKLCDINGQELIDVAEERLKNGEYI